MRRRRACCSRSLVNPPHVDPAAAGLTPQQVEDAWAGLWNCNPNPYVGSSLIGDVSGFVVAVAMIIG
jgi:hypothetical protein